MTRGYSVMTDKTRAALAQAPAEMKIPVVCDSSSCTEGLLGQKIDGVEDVIAFIAERVLPRLQVRRKVASLALHPTCSGFQMGLNAAMLEIASAISEDVVIPENWACCGFAGDRGMLHPELTASATKNEAKEINARAFEKYASSNRPCEIGMSAATGQEYVHLLQVLKEVTRQ